MLEQKIFFTHCEQKVLWVFTNCCVDSFKHKQSSQHWVWTHALEKPTELTSKLLNEIIENFQYACDFAKENDPNEVCSSKIIQSVLGDIKSYTEEAKEKLKQKNRQRIIDEYFSPK